MLLCVLMWISRFLLDLIHFLVDLLYPGNPISHMCRYKPSVAIQTQSLFSPKYVNSVMYSCWLTAIDLVVVQCVPVSDDPCSYHLLDKCDLKAFDH